MAKSKSGGSRSYLRGRIGSDVYSIGKDGKGKKQQVVRSLAEQVANPQTIAQMRGRMIMSTIMQVVNVLRPIIDHSFDNVQGKQPNISEFIRINYGLIKADVAAHPTSDNQFGLNKYQEKGAKRGAYQISEGSASKPAALVLGKSTGVVSIDLTADGLTIGGLKAALGMTTEDYFTVVGITAAGVAKYERFRVNPALADDTVIAAGNLDEVFATEGNATANIALAGSVITLTDAAVANCCAIIMSIKTASGYKHSKAVLGDATNVDWSASVALATYPQGTQNFLNGGDAYGRAESGEGGGFTPTPDPSGSYTLTISKSGSGTVAATVDGSPVNSGASVQAGKTVSLSITPEAGKQATASIGSSVINLTLSGGTYSGQFTMPSNAATLSVNTAYTQDPEGDGD